MTIVVNLLWTGGWDSTFRLLQLAQEGAVIQPHYIRDPYRDSVEKELEVMSEIRKKVKLRFPDSVIRETEFIDLSEIAVNPDVKQAHRNFLAKAWIGGQYVYTASYVYQKNINNMELSIERLNKARYRVMPCLENTEINKEGHRVIAENANSDLLCLFGRFYFPILGLTKIDMLDESKKQGFFDILNMSWFCHQPLFGKPCGSCNPCMSTLEEGFRYRFNFIALSRYRMKKLLISQPQMHKFLRRLKYGSSDYS